jgi:hypothetical protein
MILTAHCTEAEMSLAVSGEPLGVPNRSLALGMWEAVKIAAMMPSTRLRPSSTEISHPRVLFAQYGRDYTLPRISCSAHLGVFLGQPPVLRGCLFNVSANLKIVAGLGGANSAR